MEIILPHDFFQTLKDKRILLDTSVFIDASLHDLQFKKFFNAIRNCPADLVSLDVVRMEFLKGVPNSERYFEKELFFNEIISACLPITEAIFTHGYRLIQQYKEDGKTASVTDLLLGAALMTYKENLLLLTKNTTDFPTNIFSLVSHINIVYRKGLHSYGLYAAR